MNCAYSELYLENARSVMAVMFDYSVNYLQIDCGDFYRIFAVSHAARQFECGNPAYVAGKSGIELAHLVLEEAGEEKAFLEYCSFDRSPEYWAGWALAFYQWKKNLRFAEILRFAEMDDILQMYRKYHEMDISHFCDRLDHLSERKKTESNLRRLRRLAGYTQLSLASKADVPLRTVQQYEQRQKIINKAQAETVFRLAQVLGCNAKELLE